jgi:hypothetical protein
MIIVDTNVISELMREHPAPAVSQWMAGRKENDLRTTSVSASEILYGVERLPDGRRKDALRASATRILDGFGQQILPFDLPSAREYAVVVCRRAEMGLPISGSDAQIAAICRVHRAALATRNGPDFAGTGVSLINPWLAEA